MSILKFKQFESVQHDFDFPTLEEVKDYFYDFTDEVEYVSISEFSFGFCSFGFTDVLKRNKTHKELLNLMTYINLSTMERPLYTKNIKTNLEKIKNGSKAYRYMKFSFLDEEQDHYNHLFNEKEFNLLIECLKRLYVSTGFRPCGETWSEDYPTSDGNIETRWGFQGYLFDVSDEEYIAITKILESSYYTSYKKLTQHFI